ncbi:hypothetical protein GEMRC1_000135 [Eukaryota sp. GEM-RC1]
MDNDC